MTDSPRTRRLRSDQRAMVQLKSESTIFNFIPVGDPAEQYVLRFRGRGVHRSDGGNDVLIRNDHEVLLRLGSGYPRSLPSLSWRTPIFHPNIASSGVVCLGAYGQHWAPSVTLEELVGMLWDMIRYANFDVDSPYNREAAIWAKTVEKHRFPLDPRPLRDITAGLAKTREPAAQANPIPAPHTVMPGKQQTAQRDGSDDYDLRPLDANDPLLRSNRRATVDNSSAPGNGSSAISARLANRVRSINVPVSPNGPRPVARPLAAVDAAVRPGEMVFLGDVAVHEAEIIDAELVSGVGSPPHDDGIMFIS